jgi:indoleacetamide hydrolase
MAEAGSVSRRAFLVGGTAVAAAVSVGGCRSHGPSSAPTARATELLELSATDAVGKISRGDVSAERYAETLLAQCEHGKALNAFITLGRERVVEAARATDRRRRAGAKLGPLEGLPIPIKDSVNTKDFPTTGGTPALRHFRPKADAPIVSKLVEAGAIVLGKTNLHELSYGWTSNNFAYGAVHNPYDTSRIPGGSSGGTAVAVAARMAPLGVAEDTEGSIRVPAAMCGIAGFRPTTTRYPSSGVVPITTLFDQVGPHARTVEDLVLFDSVVTGDWSPMRPTELKGVKLGVARGYFFGELDEEVERITKEALRKLQDAGVELVEAKVPELAQLIELTTLPIQSHDVRFTLKKYLEEIGTGVTFGELVEQASSDVKRDLHDVLPGGKYFVSEAVYQKAREVHLPKLRETFRDYFAKTGVAAMVFPATMMPATRIGEAAEVEIRGKKIGFEAAVSRNIAPGSTAGLPGLVLPAGLTTERLPVALEFDGPAGADRLVLGLGASVEKVLGKLPGPPV